MALENFIRNFIWDHFRPYWINHLWKGRYGYKIDWNNPRDINEKMQWLACFGDTSKWSLCSDKYRVREFLKERGLEELTVKLYGVWENADEIDYEALPDKFILKCNHDSGTCIVVDKAQPYDKKVINNDLNRALKTKFGYINGETYYNTIKPCIIAEEFLESHDCTFSSSLVDYKVWSFDGKPYCTWACHNRDKHCTYVNVYDMDWNVRPECSVFTDHYRDGKGVVPKPETFDQMMEAASILSKGFPEVRVDFYEVDGKLYFGELTFMTLYGQIDFYTKDFLIELGNQCILPINRK
jgi:hypothetical protein